MKGLQKDHPSAQAISNLASVGVKLGVVRSTFQTLYYFVSEELFVWYNNLKTMDLLMIFISFLLRFSKP